MPTAATTLPSGQVTFLFTDIEGSTQRWETHPLEMDVAVKHHDAAMRTAIARHDGSVFKTVGDAFCAAFDSVDNAIKAAVDAQRALADGDFASVGGLPVRMGLHTGIANERDGDYFGPAVNRVARLMSIGHGGQVLLSDSVVRSASARAATAVDFVDLGLRRLKDLTQPEHVWQLSAAGLATTFPPLASLDARPNNLPIQATPLIGREQDVDDCRILVREHRLVTLSGAGGVGKTRVALQVGAELIDRYPHGVWFADLSQIRDPELVSSVVANVLGVDVPGDRTADEAINRWLTQKQLLLVLDNCEHVLPAVAELANGILKIAPDVRLLATSRQALGVTGEIVHRLPSLAVPEQTAVLKPEEALCFGAVALFSARAGSADTRFTLTEDNVAAVIDICRRLDGIPLAIELAAARVTVLSIRSLARHLDDRFRLLTGGSRTALPRQKTLSALIAWSYDLLTPAEQVFFNRTSIFAGGFTMDAATAVCAADGIQDADILDLLSSLTDKSMVVADTHVDRERYHLLESTRAYALEKLASKGERERLARRHGEYFSRQLQASQDIYDAGSTASWLARVEPDIDNYRATLEWALTDGHDVLLGSTMAGALRRFWQNGGLAVEGRHWIGRSLENLDESAQPQVAAQLWQALAVLSQGERKRETAERALTLYRSVRDGRGVAWTLLALGYAHFQMGRLEDAIEVNARALEALRECGDIRGVAVCLSQQSDIHLNRGDVVRARASYTQALVSLKALKDDVGIAMVLGNLAEVEFADGHAEQAVHLAGEAIEILLRGKNALLLATDYANSAVYRIALADEEGAREAARAGLRWALQAQDRQGTAIALQHFALLAVLRGHVHEAARLVGYVAAQYEEGGYARESTEKWAYEKLMTTLHGHLSDAEIHTLASEGSAWPEHRAVEAALNDVLGREGLDGG